MISGGRPWWPSHPRLRSDRAAAQQPASAQQANEVRRFWCGAPTRDEIRNLIGVGLRCGPGWTRTCNRSIMSDGITASVVDFALLLVVSEAFAFSGFSRFWCGVWRGALMPLCLTFVLTEAPTDVVRSGNCSAISRPRYTTSWDELSSV
jgi:hypothetical protein